MGLIVRRAEIKDEAELRRMWNDLWRAGGRDAPEFSFLVIAGDERQAFVAERDGSLVGFVGVGVGVQVADTEVVQVQAVWVLPSERREGSGVTSGLMDAALQFAHEQNMPFLAPDKFLKRAE